MLYEQCLKIIYNEKQSSFTELLNKGSFVLIHIRNIQSLAIEMFRFYNGLLLPLMKNIFKIWDLLPEKLKNTENLEHFKKEIKTWKPDNCPCRLCKVYTESVEFI